MKGTVEEPGSPVPPRDKPLSRIDSRSYSRYYLISSYSPALARIDLAPILALKG
jgi:hypothetical protein